MNMIKGLFVAAAAGLSSQVLAHAGHEHTSTAMGFVSGAVHPLVGLDHLLVLLAVGAMAAATQGIQRLLIPVSFVGLMGLGFVTAHAGMHGITTGAIETLISTSLFAAATLLVATQLSARFFAVQRSSSVAAWGITAFAIAHGFAHGLEIPAEAGATGFAIGFLLSATAILATGFGIAKLVARFKPVTA